MCFGFLEDEAEELMAGRGSHAGGGASTFEKEAGYTTYDISGCQECGAAAGHEEGRGQRRFKEREEAQGHVKGAISD